MQTSLVLMTLSILGAPPENAAPYCRGQYSDNVLALAPGAREIEEAPYSYCVRSTATYECLSYGTDGNVRRSRSTVTTHGTGFGYRHHNGGTLLLTNHHVSDWPAVTDDAHRAGSVPSGCKRIDDELRIVENESDSYGADDIELSRVVNDPALDASIIRSKTKLKILPWKLGKSSALKERNFVQVRGFPLGVFQATNDGKVVSALDHDTDKDWDHDDFVIDAFLSHGNSGSPVLAVSCESGEFELVGMFHAGYTGANALNVVVGIDELKDLMTTLKRRPAKKAEDNTALNLVARAKLMQQKTPPLGSFFPFGQNVALMIHRLDDTLLFAVYPREFPLASHPLLVIEDRPDATDFGQIGKLWFGSALGLKEYGRSELDAEVLNHLSDVLDALRRSALLASAYRASASSPPKTREAYELTARLEKALKKSAKASTEHSELAQTLAEKFAPRPGVDLVLPVASILTSTAISVPPSISLGETHPAP